MKTFIRILPLVVLLTGCGRDPDIDKPDTTHHISFEEAVSECDTNAVKMMAQKATNAVVGIRTIIDSSGPYLYETGKTNWPAELKLDYINQVGGVERTNLYFVFTAFTNGGNVYFQCDIDYDKYWKEWNAKEAELDRQYKESEAAYNRAVADLTNSDDPLFGKPASLTPEQIAAAKKAEELRIQQGRAATIKWLQSQAEAGDASAQRRLGEKYFKGDGVEKDLVKAKELLRKASEQGDQQATDLLAQMDSNK